MTQTTFFWKPKVFGGEKKVHTSQFFFSPEGFVEKGCVGSFR